MTMAGSSIDIQETFYSSAPSGKTASIKDSQYGRNPAEDVSEGVNALIVRRATLKIDLVVIPIVGMYCEKPRTPSHR